MTSPKRLLTIGLVTLLLGLLIFFPARVAYRWFLPDLVSIAGIEGTVWSGSAREASVSGFYVRDLQWRILPLSLLGGALGYAIEASPQSGFVDADVKLGFGGQISVEALTASLPLQLIEASLGTPGLRGTATVQFPRLVFADGVPVAADGVIEIANLLLPNLYRGSVGGYRAEFFTQETGVMASVEDTDGVIDVAGSLTLAADSTYVFIGLVAPKNDTPASVRRQMQFLGSANDRGQHEMRLEGQL